MDTTSSSVATNLGTRLSSQGYSVLKSGLTARETSDLKKELTAIPQVVGGQKPPPGAHVQTFELWKESASRLYVPKHFGLCRFGVPGHDTIPEGADISLSFSGSMRPEQLAPVEAFMKASSDPKIQGGIVSLPCGSGKTVIALHLVARVAKKTLIVVHKDFLLQQWMERIAEFLPGARIGIVKAKTIDVRDKDVVIASLQSLSMKEYDSSLFSDIGLLILDEVHRTGTDVFSRALHKTNVRRSLGLSATVQRKDGMTKVFSWFIGDVVYAIQPRVDSVKVLVTSYYDSDPRYNEEPVGYGGKPNSSRMINNVTEWPDRTQKIVDTILTVIATEPGRRVLVLSDRKKQLTDLKLGIDAAGVADLTTGFYIGGMKPAALTASQDCTVILATYSFASEGFDVPGLDTLVMASPKTDIEQSVGRILRQKESLRVRVPLIIDFTDKFSMFINQAKKRKTYYRKRGYVMESYDATNKSVEGRSDDIRKFLTEKDDNGDEDEEEDGKKEENVYIPHFAFVDMNDDFM